MDRHRRKYRINRLISLEGAKELTYPANNREAGAAYTALVALAGSGISLNFIILYVTKKRSIKYKINPTQKRIFPNPNNWTFGAATDPVTKPTNTIYHEGNTVGIFKLNRYLLVKAKR